MIDQRSRLLTELENLQKSRRDAVAAYKRTGDRNYWREACKVSQTIFAKLHELEEMGLDSLDKAIDGLMVVGAPPPRRCAALHVRAETASLWQQPHLACCRARPASTGSS
jgi:hypothetical protein